jgi:selenocysteine lyase/cysteine desulfurase
MRFPQRNRQEIPARAQRNRNTLCLGESAERRLEPLFIDMRGAEWIYENEYRQEPGAKRFEDWEFAYATVLGTAEAIRNCLEIGEEKIWKRVQSLATQLCIALQDIQELRLLDKGPQLCRLISFTLAGRNAQEIVQELGKRKMNTVPSYRQFALIDFDSKGVDAAVRASPHYYNTEEEIQLFAEALREIAGSKS